LLLGNPTGRAGTDLSTTSGVLYVNENGSVGVNVNPTDLSAQLQVSGIFCFVESLI
jgi:hypothetical protein